MREASHIGLALDAYLAYEKPGKERDSARTQSSAQNLRKVSLWLNSHLGILVLLLIWEAAPKLGLLDASFVPSLLDVVAAIGELWRGGDLLRHVSVSLTRVALGFLLAVITALPLGLLLGGWFYCAEASLSLLLEIFSFISPFVAFHVLLLALGIGEAPKILMIAWASLWPVFFATVAAVRHVDRTLLKTARGFSLSRRSTFLKIVLPASESSIWRALRLSGCHAFIILIAAEMMGASSGLGWMIQSYQENYAVRDIYAIALVIMLLGWSVDLLLRGAAIGFHWIYERSEL